METFPIGATDKISHRDSTAIGYHFNAQAYRTNRARFATASGLNFCISGKLQRRFDTLDFFGLDGIQQRANHRLLLACLFLCRLPIFQHLRCQIGAPGSQEGLSQLLLRGKVAYLFERYTDSQEMNGLVVCTSASKQSDVTSVGPVLEEIETALGVSSGAAGLITSLPVLAFSYLVYRNALQEHSFYYLLVFLLYAYGAVSYSFLKALQQLNMEHYGGYITTLYWLVSALLTLRLLVLLNKKIKSS